MKAALLIKQWSIWCIANIYQTGRLISIISEAGGILRPTETQCVGCVRNHAEEECGPMERSLGGEQGAPDPVASCDMIFFVWLDKPLLGNFLQVKVKENLVHHSQLYL